MTVKGGKGIFLDRDGTLNQVLFDEQGKPRSPRRFEEFRLIPYVRETIAELCRRRYLPVVITNQPEIKRGLLPELELTKMHEHIRSELPIVDLFVCLHDNEDGCECRKPAPGMIFQAAEKWGIDLEVSFVVGDTARDVEVGRRAGVTTILLDAPYNRDVLPHIRIRSLEELLLHCK